MAFVRWPDGREAALTRTETPLERMQQTADVLNTLRARGPPMTANDLIHVDYIDNALFDGDGKLTGIVDCNFGAPRGRPTILPAAPEDRSTTTTASPPSTTT